jgi:hypothetical protein
MNREAHLQLEDLERWSGPVTSMAMSHSLCRPSLTDRRITPGIGGELRAQFLRSSFNDGFHRGWAFQRVLFNSRGSLDIILPWFRSLHLDFFRSNCAKA